MPRISLKFVVLLIYTYLFHDPNWFPDLDRWSHPLTILLKNCFTNTADAIPLQDSPARQWGKPWLTSKERYTWSFIGLAEELDPGVKGQGQHEAKLSPLSPITFALITQKINKICWLNLSMMISFVTNMLYVKFHAIRAKRSRGVWDTWAPPME